MHSFFFLFFLASEFLILINKWLHALWLRLKCGSIVYFLFFQQAVCIAIHTMVTFPQCSESDSVCGYQVFFFPLFFFCPPISMLQWIFAYTCILHYASSCVAPFSCECMTMRHRGQIVTPDRLFLFPLVMSDELTLLLCMSAALRGFLFWNGLRRLHADWPRQ